MPNTNIEDKPWELNGNQAARYAPSQKLQISRCYSGIGTDYFKEGKIEEAQSSFEKAFKVLLPSLIDSDEVRKLLLHEEMRVLLNMAACRHKLNKPQDVSEICGNVLRSNFEDCIVKASYRRGFIRHQNKDLDGAIEDFETCIKFIDWEYMQLEKQKQQEKEQVQNGQVTNSVRIKIPADELPKLEAQENFPSYLGTLESDPGLQIFIDESPHIHSEENLNTMKKVTEDLLKKTRNQLIIFNKKERERLSKKLYASTE